MLGEKTGQTSVLPRSFAYQFVTLFIAKLWWLILCVFRPIAVVLGMLGCVVVAGFATDFLYGDKGRPIVQGGGILALLLLAFAIFLRRTCRLSLWVMVVSLMLAECLTLAIIGSFSGYVWGEILDSFNLEYLAFLNLFIGPPCVLGMVIGTSWLKRSARRQPVRVRVIQR